MSFNSENYRELIGVINKISALGGRDGIQVPTEEEVQRKGIAQAEGKAMGGAADGQAEIPSEGIGQPDAESKIGRGRTVLPSFAIMSGGKLVSIESPVATGYDRESGTFSITGGEGQFSLPKAAFDAILNGGRRDEGRTRLDEGRAIVFEDSERGIRGAVIPEWAAYTQNGLEAFKGFSAVKFNPQEKTYTLSNGERTLSVTEERFKEITAPERFENHFDENSPAYMKLCEEQYDDFFRQRENSAHNFRHNLSVYCRKEANSPCDALRLAKDLISRMPEEERRRTQALVGRMRHGNESANELVVRLYHEAVREQPLNEDYIKTRQPSKAIARPFYDVIGDAGRNVEDDPALKRGASDRNLKIGSVLKDIDVRTDRLFGGGKDFVRFDELKVVSASKEGNSITVMDAARSFIQLPRDEVLKSYRERQLKEMKCERRNRRQSMTISYS